MSSRSSSIMIAVRVVPGTRWNQLSRFLLLTDKSVPVSRLSPRPPVFLEMNQLGNAWASVSGMILAYVGRGVLFADSPGISPISLRCGLVRGKQSLNYLLGAYKIL